MSDVDLIINVHTNGIKDVANLSASVKALTANLREITIPMSKLDTQSRAVNKALGITNRGMNDHAKTIKGLKENQRALGEESRRLKTNIIAYTGAIRSAGGPTTALGRELTSTRAQLQAMSAAMRGARVRAFGSDVASVSLKMQKMGKDFQFVGRSLMINLTAPIMLFGRLGFQSLLAVDKEATRLSKVFDSVAMSAEQAAIKVGVVGDKLPTEKQLEQMNIMLANFKALDKELTKVSSKFGVSKEIVVGLAAEFAELGIVGQDNVVILTELTTTIEKLGGMDIGEAKDLSQALYFNAKRALEANGAFRLVTDARERETMAIKAAQVQLNMFNAIENVTTLTLQDLAKALPEVGSMATAFGLSMTEAAAMLAPMAAAGLDVGASATSIKTSLQRLILPTKKNIDFMAQLSKQYGVNTEATESFKNTTKTSLVGLEAIVDVFSRVKDSAAGQEGALKLMSQLFEKRQGPRMYIAIEQLSMFNKELKNTASAESKLAKPAEDAIRAYNELNNTSLKETINNFKDIGILARVASGTVGTTVEGYKGTGTGGKLSTIDIEGAMKAREAVAKKVKADRQSGVDSFAGITTEAGKAMMVQLAGPLTAGEIASQELEVSLASLSVSVQKIKNNFKLFAAEILRAAGPAIKWLSAKIEQFQIYWDGLAQSTKDNIAKIIGGVLLFLAALGPIVIALGTMQASIGVLGRSFAFFLPKIRNAEGGLIAFGSSAEAARQKIDKFYNSFRNKASGALEAGTRAGMKSMDTLDAAGIAANQAAGTVGTPGRVGKNIKMAGMVVPDVPHDLSDRTALPTARDVYKKSGYKTNAAGRLVDSSGKFVSSADASKLKSEMSAATGARRVASKANKAIMDPFNAAQKFAGEQYVRNETGMLSKKGMKVNSAGRVMNMTGGYAKGGKQLLGEVADASALRESRFAARGLTRGTGGEVIRTTRKGIERQITENQGMRLARGGIAGKMTSAKLGAMETVRSIGGAPAKAMQGYRNSILGAQSAMRALRVQQMAQGGVGPIKMAIGAMKGFASATKLGTLALKLMKLAMISTGIGVVIAAIGIAVLVIVKNFDKFREAGSGAFAKIKEAFDIFKNALLEIARPFLDLFAMFGKGGAEGGDAISGLAAAFGGIATAVKWVAGMFQKFVMNVIQPYLYMIINIVMFVVSIFKGNWGDAFDFLKAAVYQVVKFVVQGFALLIKGVIQVVAFGIKLVIGYFTLIPKAVAKAFGWLSKLPGMGFLKSVGNGIDNVIDGLYGMVDAGKGAAMGAVDAIAGAITNGLDKGISKGVKKSKGKVKGLGDDVKPEAEEAGEAIAQSTGDGFADALDLAGAMKKEIDGAVQELQDYVAGELKNAVDKYLTQAENALKKQKDAALKVFQVQIETLDKLEKAQESLTKTMAYESEKRKRIDDKALTDEQYRRNYALAVYEGRVDDARMLQLEQGLDEKSFTEDMKAIETKRSEELAKENLDALKTAINEAKEAAGKFFDESLVKFQEAAALVTKFPPITIQDYQDQVNKLHTITTDAALANSTEFGNMFETFVTTINDKMPNKVIGAFSMNLDDLVIEAQKKYGLGGNPEENSIIGATLGMLADIGGVFGDKKQTVIDAFGLVSTGLVGNFDVAKTEILRIVDEEFLTPFAEASLKFVTNWKTIYEQAIIDGNISITNSLRNTVAINADLFAEMRGHLDETTKKWLALKVQADAAAAAQEAAANAGGTPSDTSSTPSTTGGAGGRADAFENNNASRVARGLKPLTYQEFAFGTGYTKPVVPVVKKPTGPFRGYAKGGVIPSRSDESSYIGSGFINAPTQEGVPALLHGGEYILNAKAVSRLGLGALEKLNNNLIPKFAKGGYVAPKKGGIPFGGEDKILANSTKKTPQPLQGPYATSIPVVASPTINLKSLPLVKNNLAGEGGVSTVRSASFGIGKGEVLLPTVVQGKILSDTNAFNAYANGGYKNHLGIYANTAAASKAAEVIHLSEASRIGQVAKAQEQRNAQRNADLKNAGLAKNFIGPIAPVVKPEKKSIFAKAGGFVVKSLFDLQQSFVKFGNSANNIAMGVVESPLALFDRRLSYNPIKNLQNRNQHDLENGINYIRGINNLTGLNLPGGKSDGFGQVANNKLMNMGDAFNIITTLLGPEINAGVSAVAKPLLRPFGIAAVEKMGLTATELTLGQIMRPGFTAAMNNALAREAAVLAEKEAFDLVYHASPIQGLKTLLPNPASAEGINAIPKVWTFDAAKTTADNAVEKLLPYADSALNAGDRVGSIYIGGARGLKPSTFAESPISWTDKPVGVLQEVVTNGKTRGQIAKELGEAIEAARGQQAIKLEGKAQPPNIFRSLGNMFSSIKNPFGDLDRISTSGTFYQKLPKAPGNGLELFRPPLTPQVISREAMRDAEQIVTESFEMYKIGAENIGFGLPRNGGGFNVPYNFKNVDLNPYDISGLSQFSKEGQAISRDWISAHIAYKKEGGAATNLIDALLYAGQRGDTNSMMQFNNYAQAGRKIIQQAKDDSTFSYPMQNLLGSVKRGGLDSLNLDDLFLVHETQFAPPLDAAGNIALRPTADYKTIFPSETPTGTMEYIRDTIHMSINHIVQGHQQRANIENAHYIVARLKDVIDANPGALDNLYTVDTWFTPKPGEGLKIPTGSFKTFTGGSSPGQKVNDAMNALSQTGKLSDQAFFRGGEHGSNTAGADELLRVFGKQLNTGFGPHFDSPFYHNAITYGKGTYNIADSYGPHQIAALSDNAISRLFSRNNMYSGVKKHTEWIGNRFKSGGYVPGAPSMEVPAILHGGEYVVNADAVRSMGVRTMQSINRSKFNVPSGSPSYSGGGSTSVSTVNINVETFVGEEEWFKSMMKSYNVNVLPKMNKAAGNESRTFTSYNGIN